jgi:endo-1,4-beta-D-glucanase Y
MSVMPARRFPPPWTAEVTPNCFIVRDANGQALSYVYYESEPGRRSAAKLLSEDEARRIAANIAKLPELASNLLRIPSKQAPANMPASPTNAPNTMSASIKLTIFDMP